MNYFIYISHQKQICLYHHDNHFDVITCLIFPGEKTIGVLNARKAMARKKGIPVTRYANDVSLKGVGELLRKQDGESADIAKECLSVMIAIPTIHDPTKPVSLFVKCKTCSKVMSHRKRMPDTMVTCVEKSCVRTVKNMLILIHTVT